MMQDIAHPNKESVLNIVNVIVGVCLALSPWVLGYMHTAAAAWNAWAVGVAVALIAIGALVALAEWEEWANLVLGLWMIVSPWVLGFAAVAEANYVAVLAGLIIATLAGVELWFVRHHPLSTA
jgi:hypothetical protein